MFLAVVTQSHWSSTSKYSENPFLDSPFPEVAPRAPKISLRRFPPVLLGSSCYQSSEHDVLREECFLLPNEAPCELWLIHAGGRLNTRILSSGAQLFRRVFVSTAIPLVFLISSVLESSVAYTVQVCIVIQHCTVLGTFHVDGVPASLPSLFCCTILLPVSWAARPQTG